MTVTATPVKEGRRIVAVRLSWAWKSPEEAHETAAELDRHTIAQGRVQESADAPPLVETPTDEALWERVRAQIEARSGRKAELLLGELVVTGTDDAVVLRAPSPGTAYFIQRTYGVHIGRLWSELDPARSVRIEAGP